MQSSGWIESRERCLMVANPIGIDVRDLLAKELEDPEFRAEWERSAPARAVANRLIAYRGEHNLTQTALARKLGVSQPAVARLEIGEHVPTLPTLIRIAKALGIEILIDIKPSEHAGLWVSSEATRNAQVVERVESDSGYELLVVAG